MGDYKKIKKRVRDISKKTAMFTVGKSVFPFTYERKIPDSLLRNIEKNNN